MAVTRSGRKRDIATATSLSPTNNIDLSPSVDDSSKKPRIDPDLLDCPICCEPFQLPIYQCEHGHLVCNSCYKRICNKCPSCPCPIGSSRNRGVEKIVESATVSCLYMQQGCNENISYLKKHEHEKICEYSPISCPLSGCDYVGALKSFYTHCVDKHRTGITKFSFNKATSFYMGKDRARYVFQEKDEQIFFVLYRVIDPLGSFVHMTCVAPFGSDMKFSYELSVKKGDKIVSVIAPVGLNPESLASPDKDKCLLISNEFHELKKHDKSLTINLAIRKITAK